MSPIAHVSEAGPPVGRSAVKMHDSDDIDALRLDAIQETVGKPLLTEARSGPS